MQVAQSELCRHELVGERLGNRVERSLRQAIASSVVGANGRIHHSVESSLVHNLLQELLCGAPLSPRGHAAIDRVRADTGYSSHSILLHTKKKISGQKKSEEDNHDDLTHGERRTHTVLQTHRGAATPGLGRCVASGATDDRLRGTSEE